MSERSMPGPMARRSFLSRMGAGAAAFGAAFGAGSWVQAQSAPTSVAAASPWKPVRHPEDDALLKRGVRLAVCSLSTRAAATAIAQKSGAKVDDVFKELTAHLVPNARMVPAGIVAVNRAQEHGYTFSYVT